MNPLNVELLMDHKTGVTDNYYRPTEQMLQDDYLRAAADYLTINTEKKERNQLLKEVVELKEERKNDNYAIMGKLAEKEKEFEEMKAQMTILQANTSNLLKVFMGYTNELVIHAWDQDKGPMEIAKAIEAQKQLKKAQET